MLTVFVSVLLIAVAAGAFLVLADSAVRARNAARVLKQELAVATGAGARLRVSHVDFVEIAPLPQLRTATKAASKRQAKVRMATRLPAAA